MNLYDIAIARKLSGGGGGGSSDFSTAQVTVVNNGATPSELYMPYIVNEEEYVGATTGLLLWDGDTVQVSVILYKGTGDLIFPDGDSGVVITGSAEKIDDSYYHITGDCTITIS